MTWAGRLQLDRPGHSLDLEIRTDCKPLGSGSTPAVGAGALETIAGTRLGISILPQDAQEKQAKEQQERERERRVPAITTIANPSVVGPVVTQTRGWVEGAHRGIWPAEGMLLGGRIGAGQVAGGRDIRGTGDHLHELCHRAIDTLHHGRGTAAESDDDVAVRDQMRRL